MTTLATVIICILLSAIFMQAIALAELSRSAKDHTMLAALTATCQAHSQIDTGVWRQKCCLPTGHPGAHDYVNIQTLNVGYGTHGGPKRGA